MDSAVNRIHCSTMRGADQRQREAAGGDRRAAQRQLHPPAAADVVDDGDQFRLTVRDAAS